MPSTSHFLMSESLITKRVVCICFLAALLSGCSQSNTEADSTTPFKTNKQVKQPRSESVSYRTIEWIDLMPQDDLDALLNPPEYLDEIEDGSEEDRLSSQFQFQTPQAGAGDDRYQQALKSTRIMPEFDNQKIRIPGYIVPLEFSKDQKVTHFFLVPYFGACIHVPPPPPNQIIYAVYERGITVNHLHEAFWLTGILKTTLTENDVATSTYTLNVAEITPYTE